MSRVKTNNRWLDFVLRKNVPEDELEKFGWMKECSVHTDTPDCFTLGWKHPTYLTECNYEWPMDDTGFFVYRKKWYHVSELVDANIEGWHFMTKNGLSPTVVIRFDGIGDVYQVGTVDIGKKE